MTYSKKRTLSYGVILISVLLAYFCRQVRTENVFMRNLADQCRSCIYLGMYCAWVIYLKKHVVHKKTRRCLTAIGCLLVSILYSHDPDSGSGFGSSNVFGRKGGRENGQKGYNFIDRGSDIDRKCFYK